ncbi:Flagellar sensor histidine kinase FleS [hydrothermal vent metagenome]|uniref:Flagellar sensor histidine kinase FleS n=1 Tax=hydrothermal vent metagenome TaxID=652676 RepID=A0A3B0YEG8_9ZZZZ
MNRTAASKQQLQDAFELFSQVSEELTSSYTSLQQQVVTLNQELASTRDERQQLLAEIRRLQQQASRGQRLSSMGEMTARLAHQIRTPLSTVLLYASQLKQTHLPAEQRSCFVDRLLVGLRHLDHMVNDMLVFARGGQGGDDRISVDALLTQVQAALLPRLQTLQADWRVVGGDADAVIEGHAEILASVLTNLASNALDACGEEARLEWQLSSHNDTVCIALQDNGPGIDERLQDQIFEPFFTTRSNGTGLGLAVVRAVIVAHQGEIEVDADCRDGARFVIQLPLCSTPQQLPSELSNPEKADVASSRYMS